MRRQNLLLFIAITILALGAALTISVSTSAIANSKEEKREAMHKQYVLNSNAREHLDYRSGSKLKKANIDTVSRLKKIYEAHPHLAVELEGDGVNLNELVTQLFPPDANDPREKELEALQSILQGDTPYDRTAIEEILSLYRNELDTLLAIDEFHIIPYEFTNASCYVAAQKLLTAHSILTGEVSKTPPQSLRVLQNITAELARASLIGHTVAVRNTFEHNSITLKLAPQIGKSFKHYNPLLSPYSDDTIPQVFRSEVAGVHHIIYQHSSVDTDGTLIIDNSIFGVDDIPTITVDQTEAVIAKYYTDVIRILETEILNPEHVTSAASIKEKGDQLMQQYQAQYSGEPEEWIIATCFVGASYYIESSLKAQYIVECQNLAAEIASHPALDDSYQIDFPRNPLTGETASVNLETNTIITGLDGSSAEIKIPTSAQN